MLYIYSWKSIMEGGGAGGGSWETENERPESLVVYGSLPQFVIIIDILQTLYVDVCKLLHHLNFCVLLLLFGSALILFYHPNSFQWTEFRYAKVFDTVPIFETLTFPLIRKHAQKPHCKTPKLHHINMYKVNLIW